MSTQRKRWGSVVSLKTTRYLSDSEMYLVYWKMLLPKWLRKNMTKRWIAGTFKLIVGFFSPVTHWKCSTFSFQKKVLALVFLLFVFQVSLFTLYHGIHNHFAPPLGEYVWNFFQASQQSQIPVLGGVVLRFIGSGCVEHRIYDWSVDGTIDPAYCFTKAGDWK